MHRDGAVRKADEEADENAGDGRLRPPPEPVCRTCYFPSRRCVWQFTQLIVSCV
jgi:hypothetical protein